MTDIPIPMPRFDSLTTAERMPDDVARCAGIATERGPRPLCVSCLRKAAGGRVHVKPAAVVGAGGAEYVNRLVD